MTWIAPHPAPLADGPLVGEDRPILEGFLDWQRWTLLAKCAGLTGEQLATRSVPPSSLSLLGLVRHMAKVERIWFRQRAAGEPIGPLFDPALGKDADFDDLDPRRAEQDFAQYREEVARCSVAARELSFDRTVEVHGQAHSVRLVYVHMIGEYSRHNGHADLLRELVDGKVG